MNLPQHCLHESHLWPEVLYNLVAADWPKLMIPLCIIYELHFTKRQPIFKKIFTQNTHTRTCKAHTIYLAETCSLTSFKRDDSCHPTCIYRVHSTSWWLYNKLSKTLTRLSVITIFREKWSVTEQKNCTAASDTCSHLLFVLSNIWIHSAPWVTQGLYCIACKLTVPTKRDGQAGLTWLTSYIRRYNYHQSSSTIVTIILFKKLKNQLLQSAMWWHK